MIEEVLYSAQDAHTWLLDSGATFHVTSNIEWFIKLFRRRQRYSPTRQWAGMYNRRDRRGPHPIVEQQYYYPTPSPTCTRAEEESSLYQHASRSRVPNDF